MNYAYEKAEYLSLLDSTLDWLHSIPVEEDTTYCPTHSQNYLETTISTVKSFFSKDPYDNRIKKLSPEKNWLDGELNKINATDYDTIVDNPTIMENIGAKLYSVDKEDIKFKNIEKNFYESNKVSRVDLDVLGEKKSYFIKQAKEGSRIEALGMSLAHLLGQKAPSYLMSDNIIVTDNIPGQKITDNLTSLPEYAFAYGVWDTYREILHIGDRYKDNVHWDGESLLDLDYGCVLQNGETYNSIPVPDKSLNEQQENGRQYARKHILEKMKENKDSLDMILFHADKTYVKEITPIPEFFSRISFSHIIPVQLFRNVIDKWKKEESLP